MLGLNTELTSFPSFHLRWNSFGPGHKRVLAAMHRKLTHCRERGSVAGQYAPLIPVLGHLMLHFIDEWEVFALLSHLLTRTAWLDHSKDEADASHSTLLSLLHSHAVSSNAVVSVECQCIWLQVPTLSSLQHLKPDNMTKQEFLDRLTSNWFMWPFYRQPFWIAVSFFTAKPLSQSDISR